ncbi:MAG TPA: hypothetical protein VIN38_02075 [Thiobacillus sp.]
MNRRLFPVRPYQLNDARFDRVCIGIKPFFRGGFQLGNSGLLRAHFVAVKTSTIKKGLGLMANNNGSGKPLESWIWDAACSIRGAQDAPKYKDSFTN